MIPFITNCVVSFLTLIVSFGDCHPPLGFTKNGTYYGTTLPQYSNEVFLGIPFAKAPRLELAQSLNETWKGTRNATDFGIVCAGFGTNTRENWPVGEDCLSLNVVRPIGTRPDDDLPVLVWIYGGGFRQGTNRDPEFNTSFIVQTSVEIGMPTVVVSINYRLSGFGFLSSKEVLDAGVSNIAFRDQYKSFEWIKENIRGFGGDPDKVTIWGESGGAISSAWQILGHGGQNSGLFRGAIMASGSFFGNGFKNFSANQEYYDSAVNSTGCGDSANSLQCLREAPFEKLNASFFGNTEGMGALPVIDGDFIQDSSINQWNDKAVAPVNIIAGCNADEGVSIGQTTANTTSELSDAIRALLPINASDAKQLLELYPLDAPSPPSSVPMDFDWINATAAAGVQSGIQTRRSYAVGGDYVFIASRRKTTADWSRITGKKAYSFRFDTDPTRFPITNTTLNYGLGVGFAMHGSELSYEFRLPYIAKTPYPPLPNITSMQRDSYAMQAQWISFAATGSPNHHNLSWIPYWPSYDEKPVNFVYNATADNKLNLHVEKDDFRKAGIDWLNARWSYLFGIGREGVN
ncbi:MAG: ubiquitin-binding protein cue5 [Chaenotheca gracillima]|nr:MAG: ubiquitin-binding protein cue5 [Chaenotheca gracillima]